ncbi:uncharacterized protein [Epargyreus clarus]|uniref:uncharacterized protein n=1 Tax=Epargyreus clarus TaxID=520877 RepID=UPI003C2E0FA7
MAEAKIAFLYKAASSLPGVNINKTQEILKSYYTMRCKEVSKGYGLPQKHFSEQVRCSHCCLEWRKGSEINVRSIKISKRQRKRIKSQKKLRTQASKELLLHSKELEQICAFCKHSTKTIIAKPNKHIIVKPEQERTEVKASTKKVNEKEYKRNKGTCNVYSNTIQVFSLNNKKNILKSSVKEEPKIINNNKKKKDKFAGLCQKAVLATAKLKQEKDKQNKLNLFLKPSS